MLGTFFWNKLNLKQHLADSFMCLYLPINKKHTESEFWFHLKGVKNVIELSCNKDQELKQKKEGEPLVREEIFYRLNTRLGRSRRKDTCERTLRSRHRLFTKENCCESAMGVICNREPRKWSFCLALTLPLSGIHERIHCQTYYLSLHFLPQ